MIPEGRLSSSVDRSRYLSPTDRERPRYHVDWEMGGIAISDASQGLQVRTWCAETQYPSGSTIELYPEKHPTEAQTWVTDMDITEVSLAFDQNMRPLIAYVAGGTAKLFWYDTNLADYTTTAFAGMKSPVVTLDDKRATATRLGQSDVLLLYITGAGELAYRQQRDRFGTEYILDANPPTQRIARYGLASNLRMQIEFEPERPWESWTDIWHAS